MQKQVIVYFDSAYSIENAEKMKLKLENEGYSLHSTESSLDKAILTYRKTP